MKTNDVARLLTYEAALSGYAIDETKVRVWADQEYVKHCDYETAVEAVKLFYGQLPDEYGRRRVFGIPELRAFVRRVKDRQEVEEARMRARMTPEQRREFEARKNAEIEAKIDERFNGTKEIED